MGVRVPLLAQPGKPRPLQAARGFRLSGVRPCSLPAPRLPSARNFFTSPPKGERSAPKAPGEGSPAAARSTSAARSNSGRDRGKAGSTLRIQRDLLGSGRILQRKRPAMSYCPSAWPFHPRDGLGTLASGDRVTNEGGGKRPCDPQVGHARLAGRFRTRIASASRRRAERHHSRRGCRTSSQSWCERNLPPRRGAAEVRSKRIRKWS